MQDPCHLVTGGDRILKQITCNSLGLRFKPQTFSPISLQADGRPNDFYYHGYKVNFLVNIFKISLAHYRINE
jgi:hypothetical protein